MFKSRDKNARVKGLLELVQGGPGGDWAGAAILLRGGGFGSFLSRHSGTELLLFWACRRVWAFLTKLQDIIKGKRLLFES